MADKRSKPHFHIGDLRPRHWPRKSKAQVYRTDLLSLTNDLRQFELKVQYAAEIAEFDIRSIPSKSRRTTPRETVLRHVREFTYEYENFCHRVYSYREKLVQFINAALPVGFSEKEAKINNLCTNPEVKRAKLNSALESFNESGMTLCKIIAERNSFTHNIYYGKDFNRLLQPRTENMETEKQFRTWCKRWREEIHSRAQRASDAVMEINDIDRKVAVKIIQLKDPALIKKGLRKIAKQKSPIPPPVKK
jgi:hypothetical protein